MGYIYIHTNRINGKKYIGQTTMEPSKRWKNGKGYKHSFHFYNAVKKYGWENFEHYYFPCPNELLDDIEKFYINYHDTMNPSKGYNCESGGNKNKKMSEESRKKISENNARYWKGKKGENSPLYKKPKSEETKRKMSENNVRYWEGKHLSEEHKRKISESEKGKANIKNRKHEEGILTSPYGEVFEVYDLRGFCKDNFELYVHATSKLREYGRYHGWKYQRKELYQ